MQSLIRRISFILAIVLWLSALGCGGSSKEEGKDSGLDAASDAAVDGAADADGDGDGDTDTDTDTDSDTDTDTDSDTDSDSDTDTDTDSDADAGADAQADGAADGDGDADGDADSGTDAAADAGDAGTDAAVNCVGNDFAACEGTGFCLNGGCLVFDEGNAHPDGGSYEISALTHLTQNSGGVWASMTYRHQADVYRDETASLVKLDGLNPPVLSAASTFSASDSVYAYAGYDQISGNVAVGNIVEGLALLSITIKKIAIFDGNDWTQTHAIIDALNASSTTDANTFHSLSGASHTDYGAVAYYEDFFFIGFDDTGDWANPYGALGKRCYHTYHDDPGPPINYHHHYGCDADYFWGDDADLYSPAAAFSLYSTGFKRYAIAEHSSNNYLYRPVTAKATAFNWEELGVSTYATNDYWRDIHGSSTNNIWMVGNKGLLAWYDGSTFHDYSDWFVTGPGAGACEAGDTCVFDYNGVYTDGDYVYIAGTEAYLDTSKSEETTRAFLFVYDMVSAYTVHVLKSMTCGSGDSTCKSHASGISANDVWLTNTSIYVVGSIWDTTHSRKEAVFWYAPR